MLILVSAALVAASILIVWPRPEAMVNWRLDPHKEAGLRFSDRGLFRLLPIALVIVAVTFVGHLHQAIVAAAALVAATTAWRLHLAQRDRRSRERLRAEIAEAIDALTSEIESGVLAAHALQSVATDWPIFAPAASASRLGADVAATIREAGQQPGAEALGRLASAWEVSDRVGSSQAGILDRLGQSLLDERDLNREIAAGLSPSRATARLLAALPILGLLLGSGVRGESFRVLVGTTVGSLCLAAGVTLACAGLVWVERIAAGAEP